ncbi:histone RNA hairpin-binding protein [Melitaea cinxia]|uniref:histone RNA hairpin-binding protein n=1 Tax=Melitaea cinxia TaxID=113334 RepID=UPI001E270D0C|nr:histone RNA hairpin-binding protein [Melitaea cinxia]
MDNLIFPTICSEDQNATTEVIRKTKEKNKTDSRENSTSRKKIKLNTKNETEDSTKRKPLELETDPSVLQRRQKQIDYGKNTVGYHCYMKQVPIDKRTKDDPKTPDKYTKYSRRSWDMLIKMWRKKLHQYDTEANKDDNESDESSSHSSDSYIQ